jgi:general secretion pathway protein D
VFLPLLAHAPSAARAGAASLRPGIDGARRARAVLPVLCVLLALLATLLVAGCATSPERESQNLWSEGRFEEAVVLLRDASSKDPADRSLLAAYHRRRDLALSQMSIAADSAVTARHFDEAQDLYERALKLDPNWARARDGLDRIAVARRVDLYLGDARQWMDEGRYAAAEGRVRQVLAAEPSNRAAKRLLQQLRERQQDTTGAPGVLKSALSKPVSVEFRETPIRAVFEVLSRAAGLNFVFDKDVRTDTKITIFIRNNAVEDVLHVLLGTNGLDSKVLNDNTLLIYPNTPAKNKDYQELVVRTFYLVNADAKLVESMLKSMAHIKDAFVDEKLNMIVVRDTPDAVRLAEHMVESVDIAEAEVMLELEVVELSRTRALNLGIQLPTNVQRESLTPLSSSTASTAATAGRIATGDLGSLITTIPNPLLLANLYAQDTDANLLANPRIRVKNKEKAKVLIGEKLPVITSTAVQNAGVASSVSYIDVGLKLEVEPQVYLDDEVGIKVNLEVNSNLGAITVGSGATGQTTAYQVGTRSAQTTLRLHDGETQVLAGLINDNESATWSKVPGLSDIPGIGRLFSNDNGTHEKTEIVLLVTPRILRNLATPDGGRLMLPAGTETVVGARPLTIGPTAPGSMAVRAGDSNPRSAPPNRRAELIAPAPAPAPVPAPAPEPAPAAPPPEAPAAAPPASGDK